MDELTAGHLSLSERSHDMLWAIRRDAQADEVDAVDEEPADEIPTSREPQYDDPPQASDARTIATIYLLGADESMDSESAALAMASRLAAARRCGVGLLSLDPLGAMLHLVEHKQPGQSTRRDIRPQRRVANRDQDWQGLLARLDGRAELLLVLDQTGRQHRLLSDGAEPVSAVVLTTPDPAGRLAGYRRIKQLDADGVGELGVFLADCDSHATGEAAFRLLAGAASQFLGRVLEQVAPHAPAADADANVELLGQRPSLGRDEDRAGLTRWLATAAPPAPLVADAAEPPAGPAADALPVLILPRRPRDDREMSDLLAECLDFIEPDLQLLDFRPPADRCVLLAGRAGDGRLLLIRPMAECGDVLAAMTSLSDCRTWAGDHWPLLRGTFRHVPLAGEPAVQLVLVAAGMPESVRRFAAAQPAPPRLLNLLPLALPDHAAAFAVQSIDRMP